MICFTLVCFLTSLIVFFGSFFLTYGYNNIKRNNISRMKLMIICYLFSNIYVCVCVCVCVQGLANLAFS